MFDRFDRYMDEHPKMYLVFAGLLLFASYTYVSDAADMVKRYRDASDAAREVSESLGG